jgi:hypothetical protein
MNWPAGLSAAIRLKRLAQEKAAQSKALPKAHDESIKLFASLPI